MRLAPDPEKSVAVTVPATVADVEMLSCAVPLGTVTVGTTILVEATRLETVT